VGHVADRAEYPFKAASAIGQFMAVAYASGKSEQVHAASGLLTAPVAGLSIATAASPGVPVAVAQHGRTKAVAAGSIAAGKLVGVGSINGALVEFAPAAATNANLVRYYVGFAVESAGAGDVFTVHVQPGASL
jgi:hypothetical protein